LAACDRTVGDRDIKEVCFVRSLRERHQEKGSRHGRTHSGWGSNIEAAEKRGWDLRLRGPCKKTSHVSATFKVRTKVAIRRRRSSRKKSAHPRLERGSRDLPKGKGQKKNHGG